MPPRNQATLLALPNLLAVRQATPSCTALISRNGFNPNYARRIREDLKSMLTSVRLCFHDALEDFEGTCHAEPFLLVVDVFELDPLWILWPSD